MNRNLVIAAFSAVAFATTIVAAQAGFDVKHLEGSRADVRTYCAQNDAVLSDHNDYTMCISQYGATLTCYDDRSCIRTGYDLDLITGSIPAPRRYNHLPYTGHGGLDIIE